MILKSFRLGVFFNLIAFVWMISSSSVAFGQNADQKSPEPRREQLLNTLRLHIWATPKSESVTLKLRVHSGAAFDTAGKMGTMCLLADNFFPEEGTRRYFEEDLNGRLEVDCNYDYLQITASGRADAFEDMLDFVRNAVINTPLTPENFEKTRAARLKLVGEANKDQRTIAAQAAAKKLFGDFPYGRPKDGTPESLTKIDRFDLVTARDRFLTADNATLAIIGGVNEQFATRAAKQLFGAWKKSDKPVPATFRQPDPPTPDFVMIDVPASETVEIQSVVRGTARNNKDYAAAMIATDILQTRLRAAVPENLRAQSFVRHQAHLLPGIAVYGATVPKTQTIEFLKILEATGPQTRDFTAEEFETARAALLTIFNSKTAQTTDLADSHLDIITFKLPALAEQRRSIETVTLADVKRVFAKLNNGGAARVIVGDLSTVKPLLDKATAELTPAPNAAKSPQQ